ncbi:unnamed protein product [Closterium sp. Yama58-4]|nr:unnamed protein product [Closterium sp. Yama58-4]
MLFPCSPLSMQPVQGERNKQGDTGEPLGGEEAPRETLCVPREKQKLTRAYPSVLPNYLCSLCKASATSKETPESYLEGKMHHEKCLSLLPFFPPAPPVPALPLLPPPLFWAVFARAAVEAAKGQHDASRPAEEAGNGAVADSAVQSGADGVASGKANGAPAIAANGAATGGQENEAKEEGKSGGEEEGEGGAEMQGGEEGEKRKKGKKGEKGSKRKKRTEGGDKEDTARKEEERETVEAKSKTKKMKKKEKGKADAAESPEGGAVIPWKKLIRQQLKAAPSHELPLKALKKQVLAAAKGVLAEQSSKESTKESCKQGAGKGRESSSKEELLAAFQRSSPPLDLSTLILPLLTCLHSISSLLTCLHSISSLLTCLHRFSILQLEKCKAVIVEDVIAKLNA